MPYDWAGNEPSLWTPWEYDYFGAPWRTQEVVRQIATTPLLRPSRRRARQRRPGGHLVVVRLGRHRPVSGDAGHGRPGPGQSSVPAHRRSPCPTTGPWSSSPEGVGLHPLHPFPDGHRRRRPGPVTACSRAARRPPIRSCGTLEPTLAAVVGPRTGGHPHLRLSATPDAVVGQRPRPTALRRSPTGRLPAVGFLGAEWRAVAARGPAGHRRVGRQGDRGRGSLGALDAPPASPG